MGLNVCLSYGIGNVVLLPSTTSHAVVCSTIFFFLRSFVRSFVSLFAFGSRVYGEQPLTLNSVIMSIIGANHLFILNV